MRSLLAFLAVLLLAFSAYAADVVNLNEASAKDLEKLPGLGHSKAAAVIQYRAKNGPFTSIDDLGKVKGIGKVTLEKLRPLVSIAPVAPGSVKAVEAVGAAPAAAVPAKAAPKQKAKKPTPKEPSES